MEKKGRNFELQVCPESSDRPANFRDLFGGLNDLLCKNLKHKSCRSLRDERFQVKNHSKRFRNERFMAKIQTEVGFGRKWAKEEDELYG